MARTFALPPKRAALIGLVLLVALAGTLRFVRLDQPERIVLFDEHYYVAQAIGLLRDGAEQEFTQRQPGGLVFCDTVALQRAYIVHPPVGKWLIAGGISLFGCNPFGWRFFSALFGTLAILFTVLLARSLGAAWWAAMLAGLLLAVDGMHFVMSRLAMLDIFPITFTLAALWMALESRAAATRKRAWLLSGAVICAGLAIGSKQSALLALPVIAWAALRRDTTEPDAAGGDGEAPQAARSLRRRWITGVALFGVVPGLLYLLVYLPWFTAPQTARQLQCDGRGGVGGWICYQLKAVKGIKAVADTRFTRTDQPAHGYLHGGATGVWAGRPVAHETVRFEGSDWWIYGLPNPAVWYPGMFVALPLVAAGAMRRRRPTPIIVTAMAAVAILPWLITSGAKFQYYYLPAVPFMAIAIALTLERLPQMKRWASTTTVAAFVLLPFAPAAIYSMTGAGETIPAPNIKKLVLCTLAAAALWVAVRVTPQRWVSRAAPAVVGALAIALFAYFYPVLAYVETPSEKAVDRMWLKSDCFRKDGPFVACWL